MSLIYAKRISDSEMYFVADTKFTFDASSYKKGARHSKAQEYIGGLKLVVLHGGLIVAFAGNVNFAESAIKGIYSKGVNLWDIKEISEYLSKVSVESDSSTDFLVGYYGENEVGLKKIVGDHISDEQVSWIGDVDGFHAFQEGMLKQAKLDTQSNHARMSILTNTDQRCTTLNTLVELCDAYEALLRVIDNHSCETVSGVVTLVCTSNVGFRYSKYDQVSGPAVPATNGSGNLHFGDEKSGSFCISSGREVNCPVYPVVFNIGGFGLIYSPTKSFTPELVRLDSEVDFDEIYDAEVKRVSGIIESLPS